MDFFGIGLAELFFIVLIALIIFGPRDMIKAGRTIGRFMRKTIFSPTMLAVQHKIRHLPYELMREAGIEEDELNLGLDKVQEELKKTSIMSDESAREFVQDVNKAAMAPSDWLNAPIETGGERDNTIQPPSPSEPAGDEQAADPPTKSGEQDNTIQPPSPSKPAEVEQTAGPSKKNG
jgi:hypothetical protein